MLTLRLPVDDRGQGLAERPNAFLPAPDISHSSSILPDVDDDVLALSEREREGLDKQVEIACRYGAVVERVAARHGLLPSIIAGYCSRRSGWGLDLLPIGVEGTRDFRNRAGSDEAHRSELPPDGLGFLRGLMALDFDDHILARGQRWRDPEDNIDAAFTLIAGYRTHLRRRTTLQSAGLLRASFTAFECGLEPVERAIRRGLDVDSPTLERGRCHRGCGRDVLARAAVFQAEGWD